MIKGTSLLPSLNQGGDKVATVTTGIVGAIADLFVPVVGTAFAQLCSQLIQKRIEDAQTILISALDRGEISVLNEENYSQFIPMGFRFYESARRGESRAKLELLGKLIAGTLMCGSLEQNQFNRLCNKLERISEEDIIVMEKIFRIYKKKKNCNDDVSHFVVSAIEGTEFMKSAFSVGSLQAAGFVISEPKAVWKDYEESYYPTPDFFAVCEAAMVA